MMYPVWHRSVLLSLLVYALFLIGAFLYQIPSLPDRTYLPNKITVYPKQFLDAFKKSSSLISYPVLIRSSDNMTKAWIFQLFTSPQDKLERYTRIHPIQNLVFPMLHSAATSSYNSNAIWIQLEYLTPVCIHSAILLPPNIKEHPAFQLLGLEGSNNQQTWNEISKATGIQDFKALKWPTNSVSRNASYHYYRITIQVQGHSQEHLYDRKHIPSLCLFLSFDSKTYLDWIHILTTNWPVQTLEFI